MRIAKWLLVALGLFPWALQAQVRADSSAVVILATNTTDHAFTAWVKQDSLFHVIGQVPPHSQLVWVLPSARLLSRDTLFIVMWVLVGSHQMQADTLLRRPGIVNIYRRDFKSGKPEPMRT